jgi:hypothetical protein
MRHRLGGGGENVPAVRSVGEFGWMMTTKEEKVGAREEEKDVRDVKQMYITSGKRKMQEM